MSPVTRRFCPAGGGALGLPAGAAGCCERTGPAQAINVTKSAMRKRTSNVKSKPSRGCRGYRGCRGCVKPTFRTSTTLQPRQPSHLAHFSRLRRPIRPVVPVLRRAHIGHSPLVAVPAVEALHVEAPGTGARIADHYHAVGVADVDPEG